MRFELNLSEALRGFAFLFVNLKHVFPRNEKDKYYIDMKWLTKEWIKKHSRIDFDCEDDLLEMYGDDAEQTVLNIIDRTYEELMETYGEVPKPLYVASLMLVELDYDHRSPISGQQQYLIPNSFDMKVKPYMRLTSNNQNNQEYGCKNL